MCAKGLAAPVVCAVNGKRRFKTRALAKRFGRSLRKKKHTAYRCQWCGSYHLTSHSAFERAMFRKHYRKVAAGSLTG